MTGEGPPPTGDPDPFPTLARPRFRSDLSRAWSGTVGHGRAGIFGRAQSGTVGHGRAQSGMVGLSRAWSGSVGHGRDQSGMVTLSRAWLGIINLT